MTQLITIEIVGAGVVIGVVFGALILGVAINPSVRRGGANYLVSAYAPCGGRLGPRVP